MAFVLPDSKLNKQIIHELYFKQTMSCAELSGFFGKSIPIITKGVNELMRLNIVEEVGYAASTGGRRPMLYGLVKENIYILSISMDKLITQIAVLNLRNDFVFPVKTVQLPLKDNEQSLKSLTHDIKEYIKSTKIPLDQFLGLGIATPGFVNPDLGVNFMYLTPPTGYTLRSYLEEKVGLPVFIDNDSSAIALAEFKFGKAKGFKDSMVVNVGWGIGLGMIMNDTLYRGADGLAGEFSHIPISDNDLLCDCGKRGCLEAEASLFVVTQKAQKYIQQGKIDGVTYSEDIHQMCEELMNLACKGNQDAIDLFLAMGLLMGKALSILIHITNPSIVVLSGRGTRVGHLLITAIQQALNKYCIPRLFQNLKLVISDIGDNAELIGAGALVMENLEKI